ncbi:MAG TPA: C39 family peptidase [Candidatus Xenobia bacterium]|jgi:hypothetical protein
MNNNLFPSMSTSCVSPLGFQAPGLGGTDTCQWSPEEEMFGMGADIGHLLGGLMGGCESGMGASQPWGPEKRPMPQSPAQAQQNFMSQIPSKYNPTATSDNRNCGPASLAMAMKTLGVTPPGVNGGSNPQQWINAVRQDMGAGSNQNSDTFLPQIQKGAQSAGLKSNVVHGISGVNSALQQGQPVLLCGDPSGYENKFSKSDYPRFNSGHWIMLNSEKNGQYVVSDPMCKSGPFTLNQKQIQQFMGHDDWNTGVALSKSSD